jgi:hypothetical protein
MAIQIHPVMLNATKDHRLPPALLYANGPAYPNNGVFHDLRHSSATLLFVQGALSRLKPHIPGGRAAWAREI